MGTKKNEETDVVMEETYSIDEFAAASASLFEKGYSPDLVRAALKLSGKEAFTRAEGKKIVETFAKKEVKKS